MTDTTTSVRIIECTHPLELYRHYDKQTDTQPAYIELDLRGGTLLASYNAEIGNAVPFTVVHGTERRYPIPVLTAEAANRTMAEITPLAERILADWEEVWDGSNHVARLGEDAQAAEAEILEQLGYNLGHGDIGTQVFDETDLVAGWDIDSAVNGDEADEYGITPDTTDDRLDEIAAEITADLAECSASQVAVVHGLDKHLKQLRDELAEEDPLTPAEVRSRREFLGLTGDHLAKVLGVNPRTLRSWEQGRDPVPGRIRPEITDLVGTADKAVAALVASVEGDDDPQLLTYRSDDEYKAAVKAGELIGLPSAYRWSASWHRQVAARAAAQTGARIHYAEPEDEA